MFFTAPIFMELVVDICLIEFYPSTVTSAENRAKFRNYLIKIHFNIILRIPIVFFKTFPRRRCMFS
jgi:hypothetical protein